MIDELTTLDKIIDRLPPERRERILARAAALIREIREAKRLLGEIEPEI